MLFLSIFPGSPPFHRSRIGGDPFQEAKFSDVIAAGVQAGLYYHAHYVDADRLLSDLRLRDSNPAFMIEVVRAYEGRVLFLLLLFLRCGAHLFCLPVPRGRFTPRALFTSRGLV